MTLDPEVRKRLLMLASDSANVAGWKPLVKVTIGDPLQFYSDQMAALAALHEAEARAARAERERDAITRLGYYQCSRGEWHLYAEPLDGSTPPVTLFRTEAEAIAAVRRAAGLED